MLRSQSFGPERRIKRRAEFLQIQQTGRKNRSQHFLVSVSPRATEGDCSRIGITITTKIDKRAARRNSLRRRIRELFRSCDCLKKTNDIVVIAQQGATELDFAQIRDELQQLFGRARLIRREPYRERNAR